MKDCKAMHLKQNDPAPDKFGAGAKQKHLEFTKEHQKIQSRTTGKMHEISFGPLPGGLVPANPFASLAQAGYLHAHPEKLGAETLAEFDKETKGKKLPYKVKK
jgi:hypothetical protein